VIRWSRKCRTWYLLQFAILFLVAPQHLTAEERILSALNVSISVFDPGVPAQQSMYRDLQVFPRIREIESLFLPFVLREALAETGEWGAVRVVPDTDPAAELLLGATIVRSDGEVLQLHI